MKKNVPRFLAWLLLLGGLAGGLADGPMAARLGRSVPPGVLRWLVTAGAALMIISFFWFPRRGQGKAPKRRAAARGKRTTVKAKPPGQAERRAREPERRRAKAKQSLPVLPDPSAEPTGRRARRQSQAASAKRGKR